MPTTARAAAFTPSVTSTPSPVTTQAASSQPDSSIPNAFDFITKSFGPYTPTPGPAVPTPLELSLQSAWKSGGSFVQSITPSLPSTDILDSIGSAASGALNTVSSIFSASSSTTTTASAPPATARQNPLTQKTQSPSNGSVFPDLSKFASLFAPQTGGSRNPTHGRGKGRQASRTNLTPYILVGGAAVLILGFFAISKD